MISNLDLYVTPHDQTSQMNKTYAPSFLALVLLLHVAVVVVVSDSVTDMSTPGKEAVEAELLLSATVAATPLKTHRYYAEAYERCSRACEHLKIRCYLYRAFTEPERSAHVEEMKREACDHNRDVCVESCLSSVQD